MSDKHELTIEEIEAEQIVELPERDAMFDINIALVKATNFAIATNIQTANSNATAVAAQWVTVAQFNQ